MIQNRKAFTMVLRTSILIAVVFIISFTLKTNAHASADFFGNYYILRPGEKGEVDLNVSIPAGDTYHYVSSNTSIFNVDYFTKKDHGYRIISISGKERGTAALLVKSDRSGTIAKMTVQVANYKQYSGVNEYYKSNSLIKRITVSGNKLVINGNPMLSTKNGSKQLKYKKNRTFRLTKNTYYGSADTGIWANRGKKAKRDAKTTYKAPMLHVYVEGKKVLAYFSSS